MPGKDGPAAPISRCRLVVGGTVQGVGFRPFVYRLAVEQQLVGWVRNEGRGAVIEVQGAPQAIEHFRLRLRTELSPPGQIDDLDEQSRPLRSDQRDFAVVASEASEQLSVSLAPDGAVCAECLTELLDPSDRRYRYPFINCVRCGPRYTIAGRLPYDRPNTTMASFAMCPDCEREYHDPADRRFHAQPIACPRCGPQVWLATDRSRPDRPPISVGADPAEAIEQARQLIAAGQTLAIKGIGGFHLSANARDEQAVARLRRLKRRHRKPLAIMVPNAAAAARIVALQPADLELLCSPAAPIVVAPALPNHGLAASLAPGLTDLGVMLPYSPLHHLLFGDADEVRVMTSGNHPSEPITTSNEEAIEGLAADAWLLHDRDIEVACDDSVFRTAPHRGAGGQSGPRRGAWVRRARGLVPRPLEASCLPPRAILALGAELKVTIATLNGGELVVGRHLGNLDHPRAEAAFVQEIERMIRFGRVLPEAVAIDLHPDLTSTRHAEEHFADLPLVRVQHHHAHLAAVLVEHGIEQDHEVAAIVLDGLGYGPDETIWGGEVLLGGYADFRRIGHLRTVPQPGGDRAALEPWRMATSLLLDCEMPGAVECYDEAVAEICPVRSVSPLTSSAGRLFDGAAAILGLATDTQDYEGEAAARLEAAADPGCPDGYPLPATSGVLDTRELIAALANDRAPVGQRAARFHNGLADGLVALALQAGTAEVVLGGGCMVNRLLLQRLVSQLTAAGVTPLWPQDLPAGDGGLSAGQAAVAACRCEQPSFH